MNKDLDHISSGIINTALRKLDNVIEMQDIVSYALPFDPLSRPLNKLLVGNKVKKIFEFREDVLDKMFLNGLIKNN